MNAFVVLSVLPLFGYCLVQAVRDARRRQWLFAAWGGAMVIYLGWIIETLTRGPSY